MDLEVQGDRKRAFCIECRKETGYTVKSFERKLESIRGVTFSYLNQEAYCCVCGTEVYVPEINDANVKAREEAYFKAKERGTNGFGSTGR